MRSNWQFILDYFNSKNVNKVFTRAEVLAFIDKHKKLQKINTIQTYMNTLKRAGYIKVIEPGVYRKVKKIPNISETKMKKQAKHKHQLFTGKLSI